MIVVFVVEFVSSVFCEVSGLIVGFGSLHHFPMNDGVDCVSVFFNDRSAQWIAAVMHETKPRASNGNVK